MKDPRFRIAALLLVPIDGTNHWIDTTSPLSAWNVLPRDDRDRLCYVTDEQGLRLVRTPPLTPADNRTEQTTRITIGTRIPPDCSASSPCRCRARVKSSHACMR